MSAEDTINLRNSLKGALAERPDIAGTVVTSLQYDDEMMDVVVQITSVPNYSPTSKLPNELQPFGIDFESAITRETERDEKLNEELSKNPKRGGEILNSDSWHLEFTASSNLLFTSEQQGWQSPELESALVFGGDSENGKIGYLTTSNGGYTLSVPARFKETDRLRISIGFSERGLNVIIYSWLRDEEIDPFQSTIEKPNISEEVIDKEKIENAM